MPDTRDQDVPGVGTSPLVDNNTQPSNISNWKWHRNAKHVCKTVKNVFFFLFETF